MKKMITLLVATGFITIAFAQNGQYDQRNQQANNGYQNQENNRYQSQSNNGYRNNDYNEHHFDHHMMYRERDEQIARINRDFDWKINSVGNSWFMSREKKHWEIHNLEMQKQHEISEVFERFQGHGDFHEGGFKEGRRW